jgi:hypothetical protein
MSAEREQLLQQVRDAEDPAPQDHERVLRQLRAAIEAGAAPKVSVRLDGQRRWLVRGLGQPRAALLKLSVVLLLAGAGLVLLARGPARFDIAAWRMSQREPPPANLAPARLTVALNPPASAPVMEEAPVAPAASPAPAPRPAAPRRPRSPARAQALSSLRAELDVLQRVQAALRREDGASALAELEAHSASDGPLLAERQAARILALCLLRRVDEARLAAEAFSARHPRSAQRAAIAESCANSTRIEPP